MTIPTFPITYAVLVASGGGRESANRMCWPTQAAMEAQLT